VVGENLDLSSGDDFSRSQKSQARRFLGIRFACCDVYTRVYVNRTETAYEGCCPKCGKRVNITIGEGGTGDRFFTAY